ncbi:MAG: hypothetical protein PUB90_01630, partial [bacterium]|nr:hypothetical protein [bacterium]
IDNKAPVIKIEPNGDDTYTKSKTININISDDLSGISSDSTIKYGFSKSKSEEPSSYKEVNVSTGNVKITEGSLTGGYYLWIKPSVKDKVGNENNSTLVSDVYKFDNTAPSIPTYIAKYRDGSGSYTSGSNANKEVVTDISTNEVDSGVEGIYYSKDKSSENKFNFGVSALTQNGSTWSGTESWDINDGKRDEIYYFKACDKVGNCSGWSEGFHIKYAVNKIYKVYIKYHSNGGSMSNKNADYTVNLTSKLIEYKGNSKFHSVSYGNSLDINGLYDADNSGYIKLVKGAGYSLVSGKEWCTNSDGSGTCYDQKTQYSASDFCDASSSDCEVTLYANWKVNTLTIIYHANDGSLTTDSKNNGYSKNSDGVITKKVNGEDISNFHVIKYNGTIDIYDANNSKGIQLTRTGYSLVSGNEWYKKDSDGNKIYYNQSTSANYSATYICNSLKTGDCTVHLYANWKKNVCPTGYTESSTSHDCEKLLGNASQSYTKMRRNCVQKTMSATKGSCNDFNFDDSACKSHSGCKLSDDYVMSSHLCNGTYNKCSKGTYSSSLGKCVYYGYSDAVKVENQKSCTVTTTTCKSQSDVNKGNYYISSCVKDGDYYCSSGTLRSSNNKCYSYASYE